MISPAGNTGPTPPTGALALAVIVKCNLIISRLNVLNGSDKLSAPLNDLIILTLYTPYKNKTSEKQILRLIERYIAIDNLLNISLLNAPKPIKKDKLKQLKQLNI